MEAIENLLTRRSIRKYKPDMIPEDILEKILTAGTYAATGMGRQSPIIIAVTDKNTRDRLSKECSRHGLRFGPVLRSAGCFGSSR